VPLCFLDTSALLKRYIVETGSAWVEQLCASQPLTVSTLTYTEVASALARRVREALLDESRRDEILRAYRTDVRGTLQMALRASVLRDAAELLIQAPSNVGQRSLDALQTACARRATVHANNLGVGTLTLAAADQRLLAAAHWAGLATDNPEDHP
jgi:predicted nucleic acid-binding protein